MSVTKILITLILSLFSLMTVSGTMLEYNDSIRVSNIKPKERSLGIMAGYETRLCSYLSPLLYKGSFAEFDFGHSRKFKSFDKGWLYGISNNRAHFAATLNPAKTSMMFSIYDSYSFSVLYGQNINNLSWDAGLYSNIELGIDYLSKNQNNPCFARLRTEPIGLTGEVSLRLSKKVIMKDKITLSATELAFAPEYTESYYDITTKGIDKNNIEFSSFVSNRRLTNNLSVNILLKKTILDIGLYVERYRGIVCQNDLRNLIAGLNIRCKYMSARIPIRDFYKE